MQTTLLLLLGIAILSWAELSSSEPGWQNLANTAIDQYGWSPQSTPIPAAYPSWQGVAKAWINGGASSSQPTAQPETEPDEARTEEDGGSSEPTPQQETKPDEIRTEEDSGSSETTPKPETEPDEARTEEYGGSSEPTPQPETKPDEIRTEEDSGSSETTPKPETEPDEARTEEYGGSSEPTPQPETKPDEIRTEEDSGSSETTPKPETEPDVAKDTSTSVNAGDARSKLDTNTLSLTINNTINEIFEMTLKGNSIGARLADRKAKTKGTVTGGELGNVLYIFNAIHYEYDMSGRYIFEAHVNYYKSEFHSFDEARRRNGTLLELIYSIFVGDVYGPAFKPFEDAMKSIKNPGDSVIIQSSDADAFYSTYNENATYTSSKGSMYDLWTNQWYSNCTIMRLTMDTRNKVFYKQLYDTFGLLSDSSGSPIYNCMKYKNDVSSTPPKTSEGIIVNRVK